MQVTVGADKRLYQVWAISVFESAAPNQQWQRTGRRVASPLPFGGVPLHHSLNFIRVARSAARGVRGMK